MAGIYRQRHPERTVFYRVLFHYFDEFVAEYENRFEREYGYFRPVIQEVVERFSFDEAQGQVSKITKLSTRLSLTSSLPSWLNGLLRLKLSSRNS